MGFLKTSARVCGTMVLAASWAQAAYIEFSAADCPAGNAAPASMAEFNFSSAFTVPTDVCLQNAPTRWLRFDCQAKPGLVNLFQFSDAACSQNEELLFVAPSDGTCVQSAPGQVLSSFSIASHSHNLFKACPFLSFLREPSSSSTARRQGRYLDSPVNGFSQPRCPTTQFPTATASR